MSYAALLNLRDMVERATWEAFFDCQDRGVPRNFRYLEERP